MIFAIGPYHFQTRVARTPQVLEDLGRGHRIIHGGTTDKDHHQQPQDSNADGAFAPRDFLAALIATLATRCRRLHRVAIDAGGTGGGLVRGCLVHAHFSAQHIQYALPRAVAAPLRKVFIGSTFGKQSVQQPIPLAARAIEGQDSVEDFTHGPLARSSARLSRGE